ncbi:MAG: hypothetical protein CL811_12795 [Colwelliaceae bacterium]|nr:hypothetical protein [Colwelliaceae bacterium]
MEEVKKKEFRVTIFGSARIKKDDPVYKQVNKLARMIGERGMDVVTGGGPGLMKAANLGHREGSKKSGAHSIGLGIRLPHEQKFNKGVQVSEEYKRFSSRLDKFMLLSNAIVVAPGGVGTMLEFFYTWQLMQVEHICHIPVILMGDMWTYLIKFLEKGPLQKKYFELKDLNLIFYAKNCNEAMKIIDEALKHFKEGGENFCLNYKKYRIN